MSTTTVTINWTPAPGSLGVLVQYRVQGTTPWITATGAPNPTVYPYYTLTVLYDTYYDVMLTAQGGATCSPSSVTFQFLSTPPPPPAIVTFRDTSGVVTVTNITIGGVSVSGITFPIAPSSSVSGTTPSIGSETIAVTFSSTSSDINIAVTDSLGTVSCQDITSSGTHTLTFSSETVNSGGTISIVSSVGPCT